MNIPYLSLKQITALHSDEIKSAVQGVIDSGWYLQGENVKAFEEEYAGYCGAKYCVSCANGLDALTLMLRSCMEMGLLHDGDEVIVPANTYIATILSITENNLKPILVEPKMSHFQIDEDRIEEAITERTRAVMLVNLYGYNAYTEKINEICSRKGLLLFVDNAQAHGTELPSCATAVAHSFYPGKNLGALGDAGAMTTNNEELAEMMRTICNYGSSRKYVFPYQGRNSRMDEIQAAALRVKLRYLDEDNKRRQEIANMLIDGIRNDSITLPPRNGVFHIFAILCKDREYVQKSLADAGIGTMIHYPIPPHKQGAYKEMNHLSLPLTEYIHDHVLSLPCNQAMTDEEVRYIINVINNLK